MNPEYPQSHSSIGAGPFSCHVPRPWPVSILLEDHRVGCCPMLPYSETMRDRRVWSGIEEDIAVLEVLLAPEHVVASRMNGCVRKDDIDRGSRGHSGPSRSPYMPKSR